MTQDAPPLLDAIDAFIERNSMSPVTFGRLAINDPHFVRDVRGEGRARPRRLWPETEQRVRTFMAEYRPNTQDMEAAA